MGEYSMTGANAPHGAATTLSGGKAGLHVVLRRLEAELERLRDQGARVETALGAAGLSVVHEGDLRRLQELDGLTQQLDALSSVRRNLADQAPVKATVDLERVFAGIGLQDVVDRLAGRETGPVATDGAVDLF